MRRLGLLAVGMVLGAVAAPGTGWAQPAEGCPQPAALGQVVLPPAPCYDIEVFYDGPTNRYAHGVLGDDIEYSQLKVRQGRTTVTQRIPVTRVFEDIAPRLADIDGEPGPEIIVIESDERAGALVAAYKPNFAGSSKVEWVAATRPIGTRFRWLAIAGIADFDGDGQNDIAYVEKPHLDKVLRIITLRDGKFVELAAGAGFSNHRIGEDFITGGVADCGRGPEIFTPSADWSRIVAARLDDGQLRGRLIGNYDGPESMAAALACESS